MTETELELALGELIEELSRPDAYPQHVGSVELLQTHLSVLFFAGDRVYKLKKPVAFEFVDYTDVDERRRYCEEEVRLNRRVSPKMYFGVLPVTREKSGRLAVDGKGLIVDWVVEMLRLPAERMLDARLERGDFDDELLERVAIVLARLHERALTGPTVNRYGLAEGVLEETSTNVDQLARLAARHPGVLSEDAARYLRERAESFPLENRDLLERRVAEWRIREGHGDLHAGNICIDGEDVFVYDCVEFDRALRCGDVASDLAFLAMDLDHRGYAATGDRLMRTYADLASDPDLELLVGYYKTYRALVRAKVSLLTADDDGIDAGQRRTAVAEAQRYVHLALGYELPPCLLLTYGPPDAERTASADYLASRFRAEHLRGGGNGAHGDLLRRSAHALEEERSVVVDATLAREAARRPFADAATRLGVPFYVLRLESAGEAGARSEPPDGISEERVVRCSGADPPREHCRGLQERMVAQRGG